MNPNMTDEMIAWYESKVIYTIQLWEKCQSDYGMKQLNWYPDATRRFIVALAHDAHTDKMTYHDAAFMLVNKLQSPRDPNNPDPNT